MGIIVDKSQTLFTLQTQNTTYQMKVGKFGNLLHLYYGKKIEPQDLSYLLFDGECHFAPYPYESENRRGSLDILPQEYPTCGTGDLRNIALDIENSDGTRVIDLRFKSYEIMLGKYRLETLPTFYANDNETVETLKIVLFDMVSKVEVELYYGVFADYDIITRTARIVNLGENAVTIKKAQSLILDFMSGNFDVIHFHGRWAMEQQFERVPLAHNTMSFGSNYGISGNRHNPGFLLTSKTATENTGDCYGFNLVYSGNFTMTAEQSSLEQSRVTLGLGDSQFSWFLARGEVFETPEAVMSFSSDGMGDLSHHFHHLIRHNLCCSKYSSISRPVVVNNWEATYFDFNGEKLIQLAKEAKEIGADLLVMDDGWFGNRFDDNRALGDWSVNENKLGMSLGLLSEKINQIGLKFGIWFEPEMISEDSELYRKHSEWALIFPNRKPLLGRNQLVLNLSKVEVRDYLFASISAILDEAKIDYVKWDMNRAITDWFSPDLVKARQGELQHRYVLGLYDLLGKLTKKYPDILFEGCSSGGARFDLGMLAFQPQIWASDNTDAINRLKIQYGTSFLYPVSSMGAHFSVVPNHQNGRSTPVMTRANVAMSGVFGYQIDVTRLTITEKEEMLHYTQLYKRYQNLIFNGDYYRLKSPFTQEFSAWQFVSKDKSESLVTVVVMDVMGNPPFIYLKLCGLEKSATYTINDKEYKGNVLMNAGVRLFQPKGNYSSEQLYVKRIV